MHMQSSGTETYALPVEWPRWAAGAINLASARLGAVALYATDDFFAPVSRMLNPDPARFIPDKFDANGKWMDGWESRRRRSTGHDWALIKLCACGRISGFDIDTSHFNGNQPPGVSIDAVRSDSDDVEALTRMDWTEILPVQELGPNQHHLFRIDSDSKWTHLRVNIFPDGGIARLRVFGQPIPNLDEQPPDRLIDLVSTLNGGRAVTWNDASFGSAAANLLLPGPGINMGDGWETRRRRQPGNDWCILALGVPGTVESIEVDTAFYKGNFPDRCSIQAARASGVPDTSLVAQSQFWEILLPEQKLQMDAQHCYRDEIVALGPITHVRFNIFPDGGVSRLRLWGRRATG